MQKEKNEQTKKKKRKNKERERALVGLIVLPCRSVKQGASVLAKMPTFFFFSFNT